MGTHNSFSSSFGRAWEGIQVCYFLHCRSLHFLYIPSGCEQHEQIKDHSYFLLDSFLVSISRSRHHFATLWDPDFANGLVKVETSNISISTSLTPTDGCFWKRSIRSASISGNFNRQILEKKPFDLGYGPVYPEDFSLPPPFSGTLDEADWVGTLTNSQRR